MNGKSWDRCSFVRSSTLCKCSSAVASGRNGPTRGRSAQTSHANAALLKQLLRLGSKESRCDWLLFLVAKPSDQWVADGQSYKCNSAQASRILKKQLPGKHFTDPKCAIDIATVYTMHAAVNKGESGSRKKERGNVTFSVASCRVKNEPPFSDDGDGRRRGFLSCDVTRSRAVLSLSTRNVCRPLLYPRLFSEGTLQECSTDTFYGERK